METIFARASVRTYTDAPVSDEQVERLMRAAMAAPSACNQQPWEFYVVRDAQTLQRLSQATPFTKPTGAARCCIVVCIRKGAGRAPEYAVQDVSAATQNILLEAVDLGLGCCWQGIYPVQSRVATVAEIIGAAPELEPFCLISVGVPASQPCPRGAERYEAGRVHFIG